MQLKGQFINFNGENIKQQNFVLPFNNRAFKYGDGLFETIRTANKTPLFYKEHIARLFYGMRLLKYDFDAEKLKTEIHKSIISLLDANKFFAGSRIRISVFRNGQGLYTPENNSISYLIEAKELEDNKFILNKKGLKIEIFKDIKLRHTEFSNIKTLNTYPYILAGIFKKENNLDDCLLINSLNNIVEATSSNLFIVKDNALLTPGTSEGGIEGITKNIIIDIALSKKFIVIDDAELREQDLLNADEVFLTNSISGLRWVSAFRKRRYFYKNARMFLNELNSFID